MTRSTRKGFTLIELLVVISIIALLIGILLPALQRAKKNANAIRDATQLKQIHTAMVTYATSSGDKYPVPSEIDRQGYTEGERLYEATTPGALDPNRYRKDRTGATFSVLVFSAAIVPELCISPGEPNGNINADGDYSFAPDEERGVNAPGLASWDPTFAGTPATDDASRTDGAWLQGVSVDPEGGNFSYAHPPLDRRSRQSVYWRSTLRAADPVLSNRGPVYSNSSTPGGEPIQTADTPTSGTWFLAGGRLGEQSDTLLLAGPQNTWAGNVAYNDNHVSQESSSQPESVTFIDTTDTSGNITQLDNLFVDELNEGGTLDDIDRRGNAYLRMWGDGIDYVTSTDISHSVYLEPIYLDGNDTLGEGSGG